jgi:hypothetical protein
MLDGALRGGAKTMFCYWEVMTASQEAVRRKGRTELIYMYTW